MWDVDEGTMSALAKNWWMLVVRGLAALAFGLIALFWPGMTLGALIMFYGLYMFIDGIFAIGASASWSEQKSVWLPLLCIGLVSLLAAAVAFFRSGFADVELLYLIGSWALLTGLIEIAASFRLRQFVPDELVLISSGIISLLFGLIVIVLLMTGVLASLWLIATFAFVYGALHIALALRMRRGGTHIATIQ